MKCRLLYVNANTKTVGLSLQQTVVLNKATTFGHLSVGDVVDDAAVVRVDQGLGLILSLSDGILGFTHVSLMLVNVHVVRSSLLQFHWEYPYRASMIE